MLNKKCLREKKIDSWKLSFLKKIKIKLKSCEKHKKLFVLALNTYVYDWKDNPVPILNLARRPNKKFVPLYVMLYI